MWHSIVKNILSLSVPSIYAFLTVLFFTRSISYHLSLLHITVLFFPLPVPSKHSYPPPRLESIITQKISIWKFIFEQNFCTSTLQHYYVCNFKLQNNTPYIYKYIYYLLRFQNQTPCYYASFVTTIKVKLNIYFLCCYFIFGLNINFKKLHIP